jgi:hypothetical protein
VRIVTGRSAEEWAGRQKTLAEMPVVKAVPCTQGLGFPLPVSQAAAEKVEVVKPWGVEVAGGPTRDKAIARYREVQSKYAAILTGLEPPRHMRTYSLTIERPNTGHHHLLIDTKLPSLDDPIPNDFNHLHFGGGQTEATIELKPGRHTLQLLLGDENHIPLNPPVMSKPITVIVTRTGR